MAQARLYGHSTPGYPRLARGRIVPPQLNHFTDRQLREPNMCKLLQAYFKDDAIEYGECQAVHPVNQDNEPDYKAWVYEDRFLVELAEKSKTGRNLSRLPCTFDTGSCGLNTVLGLFIPAADFISALSEDSQIDPINRTIRCTCLDPNDPPIHCKTLGHFVRHMQGSGPHNIRARGPNQSTAIDSLFKWNMDNDFSLDLCGIGESSSQTFYDIKSRFDMIHVVPKPRSNFLEDPIYMMLRLHHPNKNRSHKESSSIVLQRIFLEVFYVGNPVTTVAKEHLEIGLFSHQSTGGFAAPLKDTEWMSLEEFNDFERLKNVQHVYNIKFLRSIKVMVVFRSKLPPNYQIHVTLSGWHVDNVHENKFYKPIGCLVENNVLSISDGQWPNEQTFGVDLDGESANTRKVYTVSDPGFIDALPNKVTDCHILPKEFVKVVQTVSDRWLSHLFGRGLKSEWCHQVDNLLSSLEVNEEQALIWCRTADDRCKSQAKREENGDQYRANAQVRYEEVNVQIGVVWKRGAILQQLVQQLGGREKLNVRPEFSIDLFRRCNSTVDQCVEIFKRDNKDQMREEWKKMVAGDKRIQAIYQLSGGLWDNNLNCILEYSAEFMRMIHMAEERHQAIRETCVCDNDPILEAGHTLEVQQNPESER